jgi:hypothetical protein
MAAAACPRRSSPAASGFIANACAAGISAEMATVASSILPAIATMGTFNLHELDVPTNKGRDFSQKLGKTSRPWPKAKCTWFFGKAVDHISEQRVSKS